MTAVDRREFLAMLAAVPLVAKSAEAAPAPIIDTHIHLFDRNKPGGTWWPRQDDPIPGVSALPARYRALVKPFGVVGAVVVEASPWFEENQWLLDQAATDSMIVGYVGFLYPGTPEFPAQLERFQKNPIFRGIRYSNRGERNGFELPEAIERPEFVADLKRMADAGLSVDLHSSYDPRVYLRVTEKVPNLRVIIDHLPGGRMSQEPPALKEFLSGLGELRSRPQVYMKLSQVQRRVDGKIVSDVSHYRERVDPLWDIFGENRVIFGSDWPNSEHVGVYSDVMSVTHAYLNTKGPAAAEKVLWRNSVAAYQWVKRDPSQPQA